MGSKQALCGKYDKSDESRGVLRRIGSPHATRHTLEVGVIGVVVVVVVVVESVFLSNNCCWTRIPGVMLFVPCFLFKIPFSCVSPRLKWNKTIRDVHSAHAC